MVIKGLEGGEWNGLSLREVERFLHKDLTPPNRTTWSTGESLNLIGKS